MNDDTKKSEQLEKAVRLLVDAQWFLQQKSAGQDRNALACEINALVLEIEGEPTKKQDLSILVRAYTHGYGRGHDDTVEGSYTDVLPVDMDTYFAEEVEEWLSEQAQS